MKRCFIHNNRYIRCMYYMDITFQAADKMHRQVFDGLSHSMYTSFDVSSLHFILRCQYSKKTNKTLFIHIKWLLNDCLHNENDASSVIICIYFL